MITEATEATKKSSRRCPKSTLRMRRGRCSRCLSNEPASTFFSSSPHSAGECRAAVLRGDCAQPPIRGWLFRPREVMRIEQKDGSCSQTFHAPAAWERSTRWWREYSNDVSKASTGPSRRLRRCHWGSPLHFPGPAEAATDSCAADHDEPRAERRWECVRLATAAETAGTWGSSAHGLPRTDAHSPACQATTARSRRECPLPAKAVPEGRCDGRVVRLYRSVDGAITPIT